MLLCGCAAAPPEPSRSEREATSLNQRAARALAGGRLDTAQILYEEALRIHRGVEQREGIVINLLALAHVHQARGEFVKAHARLDEVLESATLAASADRRAEAAGRKALLHLAENQAAPAAQWAERAEALCAARCAARVALANLRGRAALAAGDGAAATAHARRALDSSASPADPERANALRLLGEARLAAGDARGAREALEPALELDRAAGRADRVWRDLLLLARSAELGGDREAAQHWYRRAAEAAEAVSAASGRGREVSEAIASEAARGAAQARRALQRP